MKKSLFYALALLAFFSACQDNSSSVLDLQNEISSSADGPSIPRKLEIGRAHV